MCGVGWAFLHCSVTRDVLLLFGCCVVGAIRYEPPRVGRDDDAVRWRRLFPSPLSGWGRRPCALCPAAILKGREGEGREKELLVCVFCRAYRAPAPPRTNAPR